MSLAALISSPALVTAAFWHFCISLHGDGSGDSWSSSSSFFSFVRSPLIWWPGKMEKIKEKMIKMDFKRISLMSTVNGLDTMTEFRCYQCLHLGLFTNNDLWCPEQFLKIFGWPAHLSGHIFWNFYTTNWFILTKILLTNWFILTTRHTNYIGTKFSSIAFERKFTSNECSVTSNECSVTSNDWSVTSNECSTTGINHQTFDISRRSSTQLQPRHSNLCT